MTLELLLIFIATDFWVSLSPGPAVFLVVSQGIKNGFKLSLIGTLGLLTGDAIYVALSALGIGAVLMASVTLFQIIKYLGAAYLVISGVRMLISKKKTSFKVEQAVTTKFPLRLFYQGLLTQLSNPKGIVFYVSLLPQFVTPGEAMVSQFIILGSVSMAIQCAILVVYGWMAERGGRLISERLTSRIAGTFMIVAGLGIASIRKQ